MSRIVCGALGSDFEVSPLVAPLSDAERLWNRCFDIRRSSLAEIWTLLNLLYSQAMCVFRYLIELDSPPAKVLLRKQAFAAHICYSKIYDVVLHHTKWRL